MMYFKVECETVLLSPAVFSSSAVQTACEVAKELSNKFPYNAYVYMCDIFTPYGVKGPVEGEQRLFAHYSGGERV